MSINTIIIPVVINDREDARELCQQINAEKRMGLIFFYIGLLYSLDTDGNLHEMNFDNRSSVIQLYHELRVLDNNGSTINAVFSMIESYLDIDEKVV